jgi:hypothetical protein
MQRAHPYFGRIAGNMKLILVFRFFMMHTHLVGAQHDKHKLAGRIIHRPAPRASTHERVSIPDVKARLTRRAFRCAGQAIQDLVAGHIDLMLTAPNIALEQVRAGILAYAVTDKSHLPSAPEVPTVEEAGLPGFYASPWHAFWRPKTHRRRRLYVSRRPNRALATSW